jgi:peptide/nickel transport system permease protein
VLAAVKQRTRADWGITSFISLGLAIPNFWLGILLIILFAVTLGWMPPGGRGDFSRDPLMALKFIALPAITLALPAAMNLSRLTKASVLEVLYEDYVRTAWAKGLSGKRVVVGHVLRNSLIPVVTLWGLDFGAVVGGGAILTETVFDLQGVGSYAADSIGRLDVPPVLAVVMFGAFFIVLLNTIVDIVYAALDPRIRVA